VLSSNEFVNKSPAYPNITLSKYHGGLHVLIHLIHLVFFLGCKGVARTVKTAYADKTQGQGKERGCSPENPRRPHLNLKF